MLIARLRSVHISQHVHHSCSCGLPNSPTTDPPTHLEAGASQPLQQPRALGTVLALRCRLQLVRCCVQQAFRLRRLIRRAAAASFAAAGVTVGLLVALLAAHCPQHQARQVLRHIGPVAVAAPLRRRLGRRPPVKAERKVGRANAGAAASG